jgi:hypothetical protein
LLTFVAKELGDPDWSVLRLYRRGVRLGWNCRMPRTPALFDRKMNWASNVGDTEGVLVWSSNYRSVVDIDEDVSRPSNNKSRRA